MNQLPSRNSRGLIFAVASRCTGRPSSSIRRVTTTRCAPGSAASIETTLPTSTPAIRTGWPSLRLFAVWKTASIS
jgi:hypothetical protein